MRSYLLAAALALAAVPAAHAADYKIDPHHTHVLFMVNHLGFSNMIGLFTETEGTVSFPDMTFVGKTFAKKDEKSGTVTGDLTLIGVTKPVTLDVTFNKAGVSPVSKADTVGFSAHGAFNRTDFGLKTFMPYIGDKLDLIVETEAVR